MSTVSKLRGTVMYLPFYGTRCT